jgi:hypothetical protein
MGFTNQLTSLGPIPNFNIAKLSWDIDTKNSWDIHPICSMYGIFIYMYPKNGPVL